MQSLTSSSSRITRRDDPLPPGYETPPFPSLHWPPQTEQWSLYYLKDMWRFTLIWTVIIYGIFHLGVAAIALLMQVGRRKSRWKYLWTLPFFYAFVAAIEALFAGSVVGAMFVPTRLPPKETERKTDVCVYTEWPRATKQDGLPCRLGFHSYGVG